MARKELSLDINAKGNAKGEMRSVGRGVVRLGRVVTRETGQANRAAAGLTRSLLSTKAAMAGIAGVGSVGLISAAAIASLNSARKELDEIGKLSRQFGVTTELLSELKVASDRAGLGFDKLVPGVRRLSRRIGLLDSQGTSPAVAGFRALGIEARDTEGNLRDVSEVFPEIIDRVGRLQSQEAKGAGIVFGAAIEDRAEYLPNLHHSLRRMDEMAERAERLGAVFDQEQTDAAERLTDAVADVDSALDGLSAEFLVGVDRVVTPVLTGFAETVGDLTNTLHDLRDFEVTSADQDRLADAVIDITKQVGLLLIDSAKGAGIVFGAAIEDTFLNLIAGRTKGERLGAAFGAAKKASSAGLVGLPPVGALLNATGVLPSPKELDASQKSINKVFGGLGGGLSKPLDTAAGAATPKAAALAIREFESAADQRFFAIANAFGDARQLIQRNDRRSGAVAPPNIGEGDGLPAFESFGPDTLLPTRVQQQTEALRQTIAERGLSLAGDERAAERVRLLAGQQRELASAIEQTTGAVPELYTELRQLQASEVARFDVQTEAIRITESAAEAEALYRRRIEDRAALVEQGALTEINATRQTRAERVLLDEELDRAAVSLRELAVTAPQAQWVGPYLEQVRGLRDELQRLATGPQGFRNNFGDLAPGFTDGISDAAADVRDFKDIGKQLGVTFAQDASGGLADFAITSVETTRISKEAFSDMAGSVLSDLGRIALRMALLRGLGLVFGGGGGSTALAVPGASTVFGPTFNAGGIVEPMRFARGGLVPGGGPDRDTVPALLTTGEGVLNRRAMQQMGAAELSARNRGQYGGQYGGGGPPINISITMSGAGDEAQAQRNGQAAAREIEQALYTVLTNNTGARSRWRGLMQ